MPGQSAQPIFTYQFTIPETAIDENRHVNNVMYVQWMQEAAVRHFEFLGGNEPMREAGATWVVRSHQIEYLASAFAGEGIEVRTWIADVRRVRSLRKYEFARESDGKLLVKGQTDWVFVDSKSGRPMAITPEVARLFPAPPERRGS